jgi:hypothetical protein
MRLYGIALKYRDNFTYILNRWNNRYVIHSKKTEHTGNMHKIILNFDKKQKKPTYFVWFNKFSNIRRLVNNLRIWCAKCEKLWHVWILSSEVWISDRLWEERKNNLLLQIHTLWKWTKICYVRTKGRCEKCKVSQNVCTNFKLLLFLRY